MNKGRGSTVSSLVVRTVSFDRMILARLSEGGIDTVVNLAAGLDTRPYRLALPGHLRWVEVDLPELISYKDACLAEERAACHVERVALDLSLADARRELLASIGGRAGSALVVTEGLLLYLEPALVTDLARDLASVATFGTWMTDLLHPGLLPFVVQSWNLQETGAVNVPRFAPDCGAEFFRPLGWTSSDWISAWEEGERLHRPVGPSSTTLSEAQTEALRVMNTYVRMDRTDSRHRPSNTPMD